MAGGERLLLLKCRHVGHARQQRCGHRWRRPRCHRLGLDRPVDTRVDGHVLRRATVGIEAGERAVPSQ